jgi:hypothetical protein
MEIDQMASKSDGANANPKQIRTYIDCRTARPKFNNGAWSAAKISDVTVFISSSNRTRADQAARGKLETRDRVRSIGE